MKLPELVIKYKKPCTSVYKQQGCLQRSKDTVTLLSLHVYRHGPGGELWASSGQEARRLENSMTQSTGGKEEQAEDYHI